MPTDLGLSVFTPNRSPDLNQNRKKPKFELNRYKKIQTGLKSYVLSGLSTTEPKSELGSKNIRNLIKYVKGNFN